MSKFSKEFEDLREEYRLHFGTAPPFGFDLVDTEENYIRNLKKAMKQNKRIEEFYPKNSDEDVFY